MKTTQRKAAPGRTAFQDNARLHFNRTIRWLATIPADALLVLLMVVPPWAWLLWSAVS